MTTLVIDSGVGDTYATILLTYPSTVWFKAAIMGALNEMTIDDNWIEMGDVAVSFATEEASRMLATYKIMNFNPFPPGMIFPFPSDTVPDGYLACDGASYATSDYPELFAAIAYGFGGSGVDFNVPNLINRVAVGTGLSYSLADTGGLQQVTLVSSEMPSHTHTDAGHVHSIPLVTSLPAQAGVGFAGDVTVPVVTNVTGVSSANNQNTGGDGAHENMPPFQAFNYIIYAGR